MIKSNTKIILCICILFIFLGFKTHAQEQVIESPWVANPLFEDVLPFIEGNKSGTQAANTIGAWNISKEEFSSREDAASWVNHELIYRNSTIAFAYTTLNPDIRAEIREIWSLALGWQQDINPRSGDYLRFQYAGYQMNCRYYLSEDGYYHCEIIFTVSYFTNAEQEREVDRRIAEIVAGLPTYVPTETQTIDAIYRFICSSVSYDNTNVNDNSNLKKFTAYGALTDRKAVCQGYAVLFYRLCRECGINARIIAGSCGGEPHAWNIVKFGNYYYNVDATWDASQFESSGKLLYYLKSDKAFGSHIRDTNYSTDEFYSTYPMAEESFSHANIVEKAETVILLPITQTESNKGLKLTWKPLEHSDGCEIYRRPSGGSTYDLIACISSSDTTEYVDTNLLCGKNYYYRVRAFVIESGVKKHGAYSNIEGGRMPVNPPSFEVKGYFGGRNVSFYSTSDDVLIYFSKSTSKLSVQDDFITNGGTVQIPAYYGNIYAKAYDPLSKCWSQVSRLILRIPSVNTPTVKQEGNYVRMDCSTPGSYLIYTVDGTDPSTQNGIKIWNSHARIYTGTNKTIKVIAVRSCFGNSQIVTMDIKRIIQ